MIDREEVRKVANLARLEITEAEEAEFTTQLNSILEYFERLSELDTTDVPPTTRAIETSNITRPDKLTPFSDKESLISKWKRENLLINGLAAEVIDSK